MNNTRSHCIVTPDIIGPIKNGGIGTACFHLAEFLRRNLKHSVTILFTGPVQEGTESVWKKFYRDTLDVDFVHLAAHISGPSLRVHNGHWFIERSMAIDKVLRKEGYSHIHFQDMQANGFIPIQAKQTGLAYSGALLTCTAHSPHQWIREGMQCFAANPIEERLLTHCEHYCLKHADIVVYPSRYMKQWLEDRGVKAADGRIVPNLFGSAAQDAAACQENHKVSEICFFGRLETRKGLEVFANAIRNLAAARNGVSIPHITFLGKLGSVNGGSAKNYIEQLIAETGILSTIKSDLAADEAIKYLRGHPGRIAVIPSLSDNLPYVVVECLQNQIPLLASKVGGIQELVGSEQHLFDPTPTALSSALERAIDEGLHAPKNLYDCNQAQRGWAEIANSFVETANSPVSIDAADACICVAYYNYGSYLPELLESLARQTVDGFGLVVVNDGSTDNFSNEVFSEMRKIYAGRANWQFLEKPNGGIGAARNYAASQTGAKYLIFMDADNVAEPLMVETMLRAMERSKVDCLTCFMRGFQMNEHSMSRNIVYQYTPTGGVLEAGLFNNCFGDANAIVRSEVFNKLGGFSQERSSSFEDWEFFAHLCLEGYNLDVIPEPLFLYRHTEGGFSRTTSLHKNFMRIIKRYKRYVPVWAGNIFEDVHLSVNPDAETVAGLGRNGLPKAIFDALDYHRSYQQWSEQTMEWQRQTMEWQRQNLEWYKDKNQNLQATLDRVQTSVSWRLTRPLRFLSRFKPHGRSGLGNA
jgi:glycosyltransferase involved in cell wall biosynthesis